MEIPNWVCNGYSQYQMNIKGIPGGATEREVIELVRELNGGEYPLVFALQRRTALV